MMRRSGLSLFISGLVLAALLGELGARAIMRDRPPEVRWYDATAQLKIEQMDELGRADVVVAGTSMAWQGFVPSVLSEESGLSTYNAGLAGGTPEVMQRWLVEEVAPRLDPDVVVWGLSSFDVAPAWGAQQRLAYESALATRSGWLSGVEQKVAQWSTLVENRTVLRSISDIFGDGADVRAGEFEAAARYLGADGERIDFRMDRGPERGEVVEARLVGFSTSATDLDLISTTIDRLERRGIEVVLAELPVPTRFVDAHPVGSPGHEQVGLALADLAARKGVRFISAPQSFTDDDFVDFTHLDREAADEFTRSFAAALQTGVDDAKVAPAGSVSDGGDGTSGPIDVPAGCVLITTEDEYGFEVEVVRCGDELDDIDDDVGIVRVSAQPLTDRYLFQFGCIGEDAPPVDEILGALEPEAAGELREALELLDTADAACGSADYLDRFEEAVSMLERVAGIDRAPDDRASMAETASRTIAALERLRLLLEQRNITRSSGVWYHADEAAARLWLEQRYEQVDPVRVVSLGDSVANYAIDQAMFDDAVDGGFLNLAIAGADPEEWRVIQPRLFDGVPQPDVVIWPLTTHRLLDPPGKRCGSLSGPHLRTTVRYRRQLFPEFRPELTVGDMIMGPTTAGSAFFSSPAATSVSNRYTSPGVRVVPEGTFVGMPAGESRYPDPKFCPERLDDMAETIAALRESGSRVVIALLPIHPEVQRQSTLHETARLALIEASQAAGAEFVELVDPYTDDETFDGWHPNPTGRQRVSAELIELLDLG